MRKSESARFTLEKGEKIPSVVAKCELYQVNLGVYHPLYVVLCTSWLSIKPLPNVALPSAGGGLGAAKFPVLGSQQVSLQDATKHPQSKLRYAEIIRQ